MWWESRNHHRPKPNQIKLAQLARQPQPITVVMMVIADSEMVSLHHISFSFCSPFLSISRSVFTHLYDLCRFQLVVSVLIIVSRVSITKLTRENRSFRRKPNNFLRISTYNSIHPPRKWEREKKCRSKTPKNMNHNFGTKKRRKKWALFEWKNLQLALEREQNRRFIFKSNRKTKIRLRIKLINK